MKQRTKAGAVLLVLAVVLSAIVFAGFQQNKAAIEAEQTHTVDHLSSEIAGNLDQQLGANQRTVRLQATNPSVAAHGTAAQSQALESLVATSEFDGASVIDRNGTMTAIEAGLNRTTRERLIGADFSDRKYFQRARAGETHIGEPLRADSGNHVVTISTPIYDNETVVGTLNAALHLRRGSTWGSATSPAESDYGVTVRTDSEKTIYERAPEPDTELIQGTTRVEETGWTVTVQGSRTLVAGDLQQVTLYQTGSVGLVVLLLGLVGLVAYTRTVQHYDRLLDGFTEIARGEYGHQIDTDASGELQRLVDGFNRASTDLEQYDSDIRARKRELAATNAVLTSVLDNLPAGVLVEDTDGEITAANERLFEVLDVPGEPSDILGRDCDTLAEELSSMFADPEWFQRRNEELLAHGEPVVDEEVRMADGRTIARSYASYDLADGTGNLWLYRDVTERKRRERRLERQDFLFDRVQDLANVGIWEYDTEDETLTWSRGVREIHGVDESYEPTLDAALAFCPEPDRTTVERTLGRSIRNGVAFDAELQIIRADGERRDVRTRGETLTDANGDATLVRGIFQDVTDQKQREQQIETQRDDLELLNQMVRHDIRNDLQVLLARLDLLSDHVDETGREFLATAHRSTENAVQLTQTARDLSEVMLQERAAKPMALRGVVERQIDALSSAEPDADIRAPDPVPAVSVVADGMLESVVRNLLKNAIQHNDAATSVVELSVTEQTDTVQLRVADNGPGVPADRRETIFGKGEKGLDSAGTGIGLYLVHTVVTSYGGEVWVEDGTTPLDGAVFVVELEKHR